jgi:predicted ABC-type transport system involved in lysophospholipase L1 biosynthesis ATPase subunit
LADAVLHLAGEMVKEQGKTLVVVTHDSQLALRGDRRLMLKDGILVEE